RAGASGDAISLCTDKDVRLLADIEKMTRQKFQLQQLQGFTGGSHSRRGDDSGHGRGRYRSNGGNGGHNGGSADSSSSSAPARAPRARRPEKIDPWFLKPYEPQAPSAPRDESQNEPQNESASASNGKQPKRAALLGGLPRR